MTTITQEEQLDYLAWRTTGDSSVFVGIMEANRGVLANPPETLTDGLTVTVPEKARATTPRTKTIFE